jgi:hypothetical protein
VLYTIPEASMQRIRAAYAQFEQLTAVVAEAMGIDTRTRYQLDMQGGQFVVADDVDVPATPNGVAHAEPVALPPN